MSDYINRDIAIARLTALEVQNPIATMRDAKRVLADMPAADVVPVKHGTREKTNLIDAAALGKKLEALMQKYAAAGKLNVAQDYNFVLTVIEGAPTVDAVEVVRCKDCKHFNPDDQAAQDADWSGWCRYNGCLTDDFDFCSRGEGRDDD